jgi:hypothetical protein
MPVTTKMLQRSAGAHFKVGVGTVPYALMLISTNDRTRSYKYYYAAQNILQIQQVGPRLQLPEDHECTRNNNCHGRHVFRFLPTSKPMRTSINTTTTSPNCSPIAPPKATVSQTVPNEHTSATTLACFPQGPLAIGTTVDLSVSPKGNGQRLDLSRFACRTRKMSVSGRQQLQPTRDPPTDEVCSRD